MRKAVHWWHTLIGKDDRFYDLLSAGTKEARASVDLLSTYLAGLRHGTPPPPPPAEFSESRRRLKDIRAQTIDELHKTLVPPFDREDIQALAFALYRIPKVVGKIVERISIYPGRLPHAALRRQAELLTIAAEAVVQTVELLLNRGGIERISEGNARLQGAEGDADKVMLQLLADLYAGSYDAKELVIVQGLYELMERAVDRCRNVGNIVVTIALKGA